MTLYTVDNWKQWGHFHEYKKPEIRVYLIEQYWKIVT